ncbi:hypothetical protein DYB35_007319, partial [Aphanomyces astaci]
MACICEITSGELLGSFRDMEPPPPRDGDEYGTGGGFTWVVDGGWDVWMLAADVVPPDETYVCCCLGGFEATEAAAAIEKLHGAIVHGHTFKVSLAHASSPKGKKKEGGMMLPSGKRARDDRGDKTTHASKRTGAATVSSLHGTTSTPSPPTELQLVQSVLSDIVQQIVDMTVTSSLKPPSSAFSTSLKRKDSDADSSADTHTYNKRQTPVKPSSAHHHSRAAAVSDFLPRKMPKRPPPPPIFIRPPPPPCSTRLFVTSLYEVHEQHVVRKDNE